MEGNVVYPGALARVKWHSKKNRNGYFLRQAAYCDLYWAFQTNTRTFGGDTAYNVESQVRKQWNEYMTHVFC